LTNGALWNYESLLTFYVVAARLVCINTMRQIFMLMSLAVIDPCIGSPVCWRKLC